MTTAERRSIAVVLLSGGMDSATALAVARKNFPRVHCLTMLYGQRHGREVRSARQLARYFRVVHHRVVKLPFAPLLASALTNPRKALPRARPHGGSGRIPATYVPARNTILLSIALGYAETIDAEAIYIGANAIDYSGYPDCRPEYFRAFERLAQLATRAGVERRRRFRIEAPLLHLSKTDIVRLGERLGVPWGMTWSCYMGGRTPCRHCDSCALRARGFDGAGIPDPLLADGHIRSSRSTPRRSKVLPRV
ncbi:MAG: 7-cyano-7-deazaguanine synthase QueC [Thermoplasmata archaeon]|nr:7-cyano-7-deazaguanine synthase QueC [Thermoplasmata archaeon]